MELRSFRTTYFIKTIKGRLVLRVCNINPHGRPFIRSKILKDVYESEDGNRIYKCPLGSTFDHKQVNHESPCFLMADRTLQEIKRETEEFSPCAADDLGSGLDRSLQEIKHEIGEFASCADDDMGNGSDDDITLTQLKEQFLTKKRKCIPIDDTPKLDNADEKLGQDESDLNEPLINWKSRHSKTSKSKRKHLNQHVISSIIDASIKSEENLGSECSPQVGDEPALVSHVKVDVPDAEESGCQNETSSGHASSIHHNEVPNPGKKMILNEYNREPRVHANKYENCVTNEVSYDHLEDVGPISVLFPGDGTNVKSQILETASREPLDFPLIEIQKEKEIWGSCSCRGSLSENPNSDLCSHSRRSSTVEDMPEERSISGTQIPDMAVDGCMEIHQGFGSSLFEDKTQKDFPDELNDSPSKPEKNYGFNLDSITPSKIEENIILVEDTIAEEKQSSTCFFDTITRNDLNHECQNEDELLKAVDEQDSAFIIAGVENESPLENRTCNNAETTSIVEPHAHPEKLLSTRKALCPSSQEQLRLALNSIELWNDSDQNMALECKDKLFENQTVKKVSSPRSDIQHHKMREVSQQKVIISPKCIMKKPHTAKVSFDGPRSSRTLPNISTGCTSIQGCSRNAIAFSQRQMHDMESLAVKLMNELKSMKGIVEQKLLFEAYRNVSLKNDADEVKSIINNATKVEDMARRWISMMARDCDRFCKIMKMTPDSMFASKGSFTRERRKIMFADEAGGRLCHVKFCDDDTTFPVSDAAKQ